MDESGIQGLLDTIAIGFDASVVLEDVDMHLLAHTDHYGEIDDVRRNTILGRHATPEVQAWFEQWGIRAQEHPVRTPSEPSLGVLERWCVPVRFRGILLGYIWILDRTTLSRDEIEPAVETAERIGALLYRRRLSAEADSDLLRLLLIPNPENEDLAREARLSGFAPQMGQVAVGVLGRSDSGELNAAMLVDVARATQRAIEQAASEQILSGVISNHAALLIPIRNPEDVGPAKSLATSIASFAAQFHDGLHLIGAVGSAVELNRASRSYSEARRALRIARAIPALGEVVAWDDLGVFRALALVPPDEIEPGILDPRVNRLLREEVLSTTAEAFLDFAGNVQKTAGHLFLHRATLYQRLDRINSSFGLDLRNNGDHRLITHLGLKLASLSRGPDL